MFQRDDLFDAAQSVVDFRFDERVTAVFPDMIHRSVPGYATLLQLIGVIGAGFVGNAGLVYDLGCSLGGATIALSRHLNREANIIAVDLSSAMVERFRAWVEGSGLEHIAVVQDDILSFAMQPCELVMMNLTMQFLPPDTRDGFLSSVYAALKPGGALIISEKNHPTYEDFRIWHEAFKRMQGYSDMAIAQKRESLEHVMQTDTTQKTEQRLRLAGFSHVERFFQALQFHAWVAVK